MLEHHDERVLEQILGHGPLRDEAADDGERGRRDSRSSALRTATSPGSRGLEARRADTWISRSLCIFCITAMPAMAKGRKGRVDWLYFRPRAGMAELQTRRT